jgi:SAM-dependent methyltransferase
MAEEILVELADQVRRHPWWQARAAIALDLLSREGVHPPAKVIDAGCGWGVTLEALERQGYRVTGMDISRKALENLDRSTRRLIEADLTQPVHRGESAFDAVLALDVIEHIDDDRAAIGRLAGLLRPGGTLIVSVPALPELFTEFDTIQEHRRRYVPETLAATFAGKDLELKLLFWWGSWLVPVLKRQRSRRRSRPGETSAQVYRRYLKLPPWPIPWAARLAFFIERRLAPRNMFKTGTSLFAVARRAVAAG